MSAYLQSMRPEQWVKNLFVLIPLVFAGRFFDMGLFKTALMAFAVFCLASSAIYVLNDLLDVDQDKRHPKKRHRPLPSGKISFTGAFLFWCVLLFLTGLLANKISVEFFVIISGYLTLMFAYSFCFKRILFLDVIVIALGYVSRVLGGGVAVDVKVTDWMLLMIFLFTLYLMVSRRRQEIKNLEKLSKKTREVLSHYTIELIDQLNTIIVPIVITAYIIYTFSERPNNIAFIATIPIIMYCFFRHLYLMKKSGYGESISDYVRGDWKIVAACFAWFVLTMTGLHF